MTGFFVMSGYVLCYVYQNKNFAQKKEIVNFYIKRFAKIYPTYLFGTIVYFLVIKPEVQYSNSEWIRIVLNDLLLLQSFFPRMFELGINGGTWSISVEAFFYLFFPLIMVLFLKRPRNLLLIGLFFSFIININILNDTTSGGYYSNPIMRINEFIIGISFYLLSSNNKLNNLPKAFRSSTVLSICLFVLTILEQAEGKYSYMGLHFFIVPLFGLLLSSFFFKKSAFWSSGVMNYLGKISYSFYMWQFVAIEFGKFLKNNILANSWIIMLCVLLLNIFIASLSYFIIEERFRRFIIEKLTIKSAYKK